MRFRTDSEDERAFRAEVRDWMETHVPDELRFRVGGRSPEGQGKWHRLLFERGWVAPQWPRHAGGMGATFYEQIILVEEMARAGAPPLHSVGLNFVGPILIEFGTPEQKSECLPKILSGEHEWAQGYSEPGAGSDLASLRTAARVEGDHFVVNGHKIWQTWGHHADRMFTLVRTDPERPKHRGLSCVIIDMNSPGITARPIVNLGGDDELSEIFLDDVMVPAANLVGELHGGWSLANSLLARERLAGSNPQHSIAALARIRRVARVTEVWGDPAFRDRFAAAEIDVMALSALFWHAVERDQSGAPVGSESSMTKLLATQTLQRVADLLVEAAGPFGAEWQSGCGGENSEEIVELFLQVRRATIFGGSAEIQRNIISRRLLDLPDRRAG